MGSKILTIFTVGEPLPVDCNHAKIRSMGYLANRFSNSYGIVNWVAPSFDHISKKHRSINGTLSISKNQNLHIFKSKSYKKNLSIRRILYFFDCGNHFLRFLKKNKTDILVVPLEFLPYCRKIVKYCKNKKICLIPDLLDMWDMSYNVANGIYRIFLLPYKIFMESGHKYALKYANGFVSLSEPMRDWCSKYLNRELDLKRDRVFPLGFTKTELDCFEKSSKTANKTIIFSGGLNKFVNFNDIYVAAKNVKNWNFVICGGGTFLDEFKKKYALENIVFLGQVSFDEVCKEYKKACLSILPYDSKSFSYHAPNKFGEYLAFNLPILLKPAGYMKNLITEFDCGINYKNGAELSNILLNLTDETIIKMKSNCDKLFNKMFDGEKIYDDFCKYLIEMVANHE